MLSLIGEMVQVFSVTSRRSRPAALSNAVFQQRLHRVLAVAQDNAPARRRLIQENTGAN